MFIRKMSVKDWIGVQDNPIQRNTARRAPKAKHLYTPIPTHAIVFAAELPDRTLVKLDGHTRAYLWEHNEVKAPQEIQVIVQPVKDLDEARSLYKTFDAREAVETIPDKISGGFHDLHFEPQSSLLKKGSIAVALRLAWNAVYEDAPLARSGRSDNTGIKIDLYDLLNEFSAEVFALDAFNLRIGDAPSGVVAAFIMSYRKYGEKILPFWTAVFGNAGMKIDGRMDGVQAVTELMLQRKTRGWGGWQAALDTCSRILNAIEKWFHEETFSSVPRPINITGYAAGKQSQYRLLRVGE